MNAYGIDTHKMLDVDSIIMLEIVFYNVIGFYTPKIDGFYIFKK